MRRLILACAAVALMARPWAEAQPATVALQPFTSVQICTAFGALIEPTASAYQLVLDAEQSVKNAVTTSISAAGVLTIGTSEDFQSDRPIKLTVRLPATALKAVTVNAPVTSQVAVAPGFTPGAGPFSASLTGSGDLFLLNLTAANLTLANNGAGTLAARGSFNAAQVTSNGAGTTFIGGGRLGTVTAAAGGVGQIVVDPTNPDAAITGSTQLLGKISYTRGTCDIVGSNIPGVTGNPAAAAVSQLLGSNPFGALGQASCQRVTQGIPALQPKFSCGLRAQGVFDCSASGFSGSASTSGPGGSTSLGPGGSASTSGGGVAFAGSGGQVQFAQGGGSGQQVLTSTGAVQTIPCAAGVTPASLSMV